MAATTKSKTNTSAAPTTTQNKKGLQTNWTIQIMKSTYHVQHNLLTGLGLPSIKQTILCRAITKLKNEQAGNSKQPIIKVRVGYLIEITKNSYNK